MRSTLVTCASRKGERAEECSPKPVISTCLLPKPLAKDEVAAAHRSVRRQAYQSQEEKEKGEMTKMTIGA